MCYFLKYTRWNQLSYSKGQPVGKSLELASKLIPHLEIKLKSIEEILYIK